MEKLKFENPEGKEEITPERIAEKAVQKSNSVEEIKNIERLRIEGAYTHSSLLKTIMSKITVGTKKEVTKNEEEEIQDLGPSREGKFGEINSALDTIDRKIKKEKKNEEDKEKNINKAYI